MATIRKPRQALFVGWTASCRASSFPGPRRHLQRVLDADTCRGHGGPPPSVTPARWNTRDLNSSERLPPRQRRKVDMLAPQTPPRPSAAIRPGGKWHQSFGPTNPSMTAREMDGPAAMGIASLKDSTASPICVESGTTPSSTWPIAMREQGNRLHPLNSAGEIKTYAAYWQTLCGRPTSDRSQLAPSAVAFPDPIQHVLLPCVMSKEPLNLRQASNGDPALGRCDSLDLVYALFQAEELGITQANVAEKLAVSPSQHQPGRPCAASLVLGRVDFGKQPVLPADFRRPAVTAVGKTTAKSSERNVGRVCAETGSLPKTRQGPTVA